MNIFEYARNRIKSKYKSQLGKNDEFLEKHELQNIDYYEQESKGGIINSIKYRIKTFWEVQSENEKTFFCCVLFAIILMLGIIFYNFNDMPVNRLLITISDISFTCFVVLVILFFYRLIRKRFIKKRSFYIIFMIFFLLSIPYMPVLCGYETTQIGDFYEAEEYKEKYYVIMSREPETITNRKQYTLPAEIERQYDYAGTTDVYEDYYFQEHGGDDIYILNYHINYLYFPDGGYLSFDYDYQFDEPLQVNQEIEATDYYGDTYYITLTNEKAK